MPPAAAIVRKPLQAIGKSGIGRQLMTYVLIFSSLITLILTALQLYRDFNLDVSLIDQRLDQVRISSQSSLENSLWVVDDGAVSLQLDALIALPDIEYVEITGVNGETIFVDGVRPVKHTVDRELPLNYFYLNKIVPLGSLQIVATLEGAYQRLKDRVIIILVSQATKTFIVSLFIVNWLITRHIVYIADHVHDTNLSGEGNDLTLDRKPLSSERDDELQELVEAFNAMKHELLTAYTAIQATNIQLEQRVERRTRELSESNTELEAFSYSVSHDLRAPLRTLAGFSRILIEDHQSSLDEKGQDYLRRIARGAQKMDRLIDSLLALSRTSRQALKPGPLDLSIMAQEIARMLKQAEPDRQVTFDIASPLEAIGDHEYLRIVLDNLIGNAWKYTAKQDDATIVVGVEQSPTKDRVFFVKDNGCGFDMSYANKLFTPFQRLHADEEFAGSGIGLATVQRVIARHRGDIWADTTLGEGAVFYFTLPGEKDDTAD